MPKISEIARPLKIGSSRMKNPPIIAAIAVNTMGLARTLAAHLAPRHITANAIAPGLFPSKMTAGIIDQIAEWCGSVTSSAGT